MSGKSKEEVAFELVAKLKGVGVWGENNRAEILDMYAECLEATSGLRKFKGSQAEVAPAAKPFVPAQQQAQATPLQAVTPAQHQQVLQQAMTHQPQHAAPAAAQAYNPQAPR